MDGIGFRMAMREASIRDFESIGMSRAEAEATVDDIHAASKDEDITVGREIGDINNLFNRRLQGQFMEDASVTERNSQH